MTKLYLIERLAESLGITKKFAAEVVNKSLELIIKGVRKNWEFRIQGFWCFKKHRRKARTGVNPSKPSELIAIPAMNVVGFRAGSDFRAAIK